MRIATYSLIFVLAVCGTAAADQGRTEIGPTDTFPIVIDEPGSYVLTADLAVVTDSLNAIEINADRVSLDLGGHVIRGPGESTSTGVGIYALQRADLTIRNGTVVEFAWGLYVANVDTGEASHRIEDLTVGRCGTEGVSFSGGTARNLVVHDNGLINNTGYGLNCGVCTIRDVNARNNYNGIRLSRGSAENCIATDSLFYGFTLVNASLHGGAASDNGGPGIFTNMKSVIIGVVVENNEGWGIQLISGSQSNVINCTGGDNALGNITGCGDGNGCHQNYLP